MPYGFDEVNDTLIERRSFGAIVATMDLQQGLNFFSAVHEQRTVRNVGLLLNIEKALLAYRRQHGTLPMQIVIYHGDIRDRNISYVNNIGAKRKCIYG